MPVGRINIDRDFLGEGEIFNFEFRKPIKTGKKFNIKTEYIFTAMFTLHHCYALGAYESSYVVADYGVRSKMKSAGILLPLEPHQMSADYGRNLLQKEKRK